MLKLDFKKIFITKVVSFKRLQIILNVKLSTILFILIWDFWQSTSLVKKRKTFYKQNTMIRARYSSFLKKTKQNWTLVLSKENLRVYKYKGDFFLTKEVFCKKFQINSNLDLEKCIILVPVEPLRLSLCRC